MALDFINLNKSPKQFFDILPTDWQDIIVSEWDAYKKTATIYVLKDKNEIVAGGIVFLNSHPEMTDFEQSFQYLFSEGYLYIGYLWVIPQKRNQQLASKWLDKLKEENKNQKYWLTIEEESLSYFYKKNGFKLLKESTNSASKEWLLTYSPIK
ncbi:GNAT family N-acetyltransferase [uncultured Lutibacter sp.]|uniref:GNAT family N-acetyltransferase n=1 Tax=uncultured Lutibacter sp. TaxID=437739 RepID=UPI002636E877|nr:GNAT family N-acetyltransferase [uncultured Lutibacter sp.]